MKKEEVAKSSTQFIIPFSRKEYNSRIKIRNCRCGSPPKTRVDSTWRCVTVTLWCDNCGIRQDITTDIVNNEDWINDLNSVLWVMSEAVEEWNRHSMGDFPIVYGRRR